MNTIKTTIIIGAILIGSLTSYAQSDGAENRRKRIEAQKVAFITTELDLTPEEAQVFWPVYNQAQAEKIKLRKEQHAMRGKQGKDGETQKTIDSMSDSELEEMMDAMMAHRQAELDLQKKYLQKYKEVIPIKKVAKLYRAEKKFKRKLMSEIKDKGQQQRGGQKSQHTRPRPQNGGGGR